MAGKGVNDRDLAAQVRTLALNKIKALFEADKLSIKQKVLHDAILIKLAGTVLPRLNEITGEDGQPLIIQIAKEIADKNGIINDPNASTSDNSQGQPQV